LSRYGQQEALYRTYGVRHNVTLDALTKSDRQFPALTQSITLTKACMVAAAECSMQPHMPVLYLGADENVPKIFALTRWESVEQ
jgi:hypothetical protein